MARIGLSSAAFVLIPEGRTVLKCVDVIYDEKFGNLQIVFVNKDGIKHIEKYMLIKSNGEQSEGALKAFSFTARRLLHSSPDDVDTSELIGKYLKTRIEHEVVLTNSGKTITVVRLQDKEEADIEDIKDYFPNDVANQDDSFDLDNVVI